MSGFAEVRFKGSRKAYFSFADLDLRPGHHVVVEADVFGDSGDFTLTVEVL